MKKYSKIIAIATLILSLIGIKLASAQEFENTGLLEYKNNFYFNPFMVFTSVFQISYERNFGSGSIMIVGGGILSENDSRSKKGFNTELHYRFKLYNYHETLGKISGYPKHNVIYYMSPYFQYKNQEINYTGNINGGWGWVDDNQQLNTSVKSYGGGVIFGSKFIMYEKVTLDIFVGGSIRYSEFTSDSDNPDDYSWVSVTKGILSPFYTGVLPKVGMQFGINF